MHTVAQIMTLGLQGCLDQEKARCYQHHSNTATYFDDLLSRSDIRPHDTNEQCVCANARQARHTQHDGELQGHNRCGTASSSCGAEQTGVPYACQVNMEGLVCERPGARVHDPSANDLDACTCSEELGNRPPAKLAHHVPVLVQRHNGPAPFVEDVRDASLEVALQGNSTSTSSSWSAHEQWAQPQPEVCTHHHRNHAEKTDACQCQ